MTRKVTAVFALLVLILMAPGMAQAAKMKSYTADMETVTAQGTFMMKMAVADNKQRMEMTQQGEKMISIIRMDKKVMWTIMANEKMYMEMPLDMSHQDINSKLNDPNSKVTKEPLGNETIDGHPCKKYHMSMTRNGKKEDSGYLWEATDLDNFPIRYQPDDKSSTVTWKNIKFGAVPDSTFEPPAGFQKMTMPAMGGMGGMGMPGSDGMHKRK
ncbi:MAG: DUF4412 domain-containing protein [Nitrospinae bacterium]|nr:DUF4412 domain-containing protein [Nitrospinota bacterium]